jgi:hypothetical protein
MRSREPASVVNTTRFLNRIDLNSEPHLALGALFGAYAVVVLWVTLTHPFGGRTFAAVTDVLGILPPFAAGCLALLAGQRASQVAQLGWRLLGLGCLCWGAGDTVWALYEVILQQNPFPSLADVGYLSMLPFVAAGLICLTSERRRLAQARPTLDGLALVLSATALVWLFVLHPTYTDSSASALEKVISAAYPVGDMVVVYALVVAVQRRSGSRDGAVLSTLLGGMLLLVAADLYFAYLTLNDKYSATSIVNVGWPYGFLLIGYAAALGSSSALTYEAEESAVAAREWKLPAALFVLLLGPVVAAAREDSPAISAPLYGMVAIAVLAIVARVAINLGLARDIDAQRERLINWILDHKQAAA